MAADDNTKTAGASLRIFTDETNLDFVTSALRVSPSAMHLKGERRSKRNPDSSVFEQSLWIYDSTLPEAAELHEHIASILGVLESARASFDAIRSRTTYVDMFCMFSSENGQGSAELDAALLKRLADQRIDLLIDLYPPS